MVAFVTAQLEELAGLVEGLIAERDAERARANRARGLLREVYEGQPAACVGTSGLRVPCESCIWCRVRAHLGRAGG